MGRSTGGSGRAAAKPLARFFLVCTLYTYLVVSTNKEVATDHVKYAYGQHFTNFVLLYSQ